MASARALLIAAALALPLGGCASTDFDPADWFAGDWFSSKRPLPGQRKDLFPEGVPGVARGVPPELMKGNQAAYQEPPPVRPVVLPDEPKAKPKPKPRPKVEAAVEPEGRPTAVTVRPKQQQQQQQPQQAQWPDPPATKRPPAQQPQWPDPPGGGGARPGGGVQWPDPPAPR